MCERGGWSELRREVEGEKGGLSERLGDCVDEGEWVLCVRGGDVGLRVCGTWSLMVGIVY